MTKKVVSINRAGRRAAASGAATPKRRGRPAGSKNKPVDRPVQPKYETIPMYCQRHFCSRATFYNTHAPHLKIVKFGNRVLIDTEYADQVAERIARKPGEAASRDKREAAPGPT
jgi:hypothetical protein